MVSRRLSSARAAIRRILRALIEGHADVRAQRNLHIHRVLGREEMAAAIEMRAEPHALIRNLAQLREAEDLKAAGVGEHGARPADEPMQSAHAPDRLVPRAQIEVIGVAENDLRAQRLNHVLRHSLDAPAVPTGMNTGFPRSGAADRSARGGRRLGGVEQIECEAHLLILSAGGNS